MKRRDVLHLGGVVALAVAPRFATAAQPAGHGCYISGKNQTRCQVGFPYAPFIEPQACRSLCWANTVAYVLRGYGAKISVDSVIHRMDVPGSCRVRDDVNLIARAAGMWRDDTGRAFWVKVNRLIDISHGSFSAVEFQPLVDALSKKPLIVGTRGHSMVLTQMEYIDAPMVMMRQNKLTLRDPWNGTKNLRVLDYDDTPEQMFAFTLDVRRV